LHVHRQVLEAAVIALPDERWGERPLLIVVPQPNAGLPQGLLAALLKHCVMGACVHVSPGLRDVLLSTSRHDTPRHTNAQP
jgi:acyl-CoA synthetase (AMP-forming)/AMP-acid ligase II